MDAVGGDEFNQIVAATRAGGTIYSYGMLSGKQCKFDPLDVSTMSRKSRCVPSRPPISCLTQPSTQSQVVELEP